jgi:hypothetical protein
VRVVATDGLAVPGAVVSLLDARRDTVLATISTGPDGVALLAAKPGAASVLTTLNGFHPDRQYVKIPRECEGQLEVVLGVAPIICPIEVVNDAVIVER